MKKLLFFVFVLLTFQVKAQITGTYQIKGADTVKIWKVGGSINPNATELILKNSSDTVPGFLWNKGNGVTGFKRPLTKINSTTYLVGIDTLSTGVGGGGSPGGANTNIQINYGSSFVGVPTFLYDTTKKVLVSGGSLNTFTSAANGLIVGESNISNGAYGSTIGFGNMIGSYGYAFGVGNQANGYSISVGNGNTGTNAISATFGNNLINTYQNSLVIGAFNDTTAWPNAAVASNTSLFPAFSIGYGQDNSTRKNVFTVLHNGGVILNLQNNSTLDSVLSVDINGNIIQRRIITGGGSGTLDSVGLIMPVGLTVSGSPVTGTGGHLTVTTALNGVVHAGSGAFTGSQIVNADVNDVDWSKITGTPTTVTGYGITNAVRTDITYANPIWITSLPWTKITSTPTNLSGYGITDPVVLTSGSYSNPAWITQLAWSKIISTPTTISGYGITDNLVRTVNGQTGTVITKNADSLKSLPVDTSLRRNGYVLAFDSTLHKWYLAVNGAGGGATTFSGLSDVTVSSPLNNQIPVYVTGTSKWTNTSVSTSIISEGTNLYWTNGRFDTRFGTKTTDTLPEGTNNLYYTNTRARNAISGATPLVYVPSTGVMSIQQGTTSQNGYISSTDWNRFQNKVGTIKTILNLYSFSTSGLTDSSAVIITDSLQGGTFVWLSGSTAVDDSIINIKPTATGGAGRWKRLFNGILDSRWWGMNGDGVTNVTAKMQRMIDFASSNVYHSCFFHDGTYIIDSLLWKTTNLIGESRRTRFKSAGTAVNGFIQLASSPLAEVKWESISLLGNNLNSHGFYMVAIPQGSSPFTGGWWNSHISDADISGFRKDALHFECIDGAGDMAHQFCQLEKLYITTGADTTSRGIYSYGQWNQISANDLEINGPGASLKNSEGIHLESAISSNDQIWGANTFNNLTIQGFWKAVYTQGVTGTTFENLWFEVDSIAVHTAQQSRVSVNHAHMANVALSGQYIFGNDNSVLDVDDIGVYGAYTGRFYTSPAGSSGGGRVGRVYGQGSNTMTTVFYTPNINVASNALATGYFDNVLTNPTTSKSLFINTITSNLAVGARITITANAGTGFVQFRAQSGNIALPANMDSTCLILRAGQAAIFERRDLINLWVLVAVSKPEIYMNTVPASDTWFTGEVVWNNNPIAGTASFWTCKQGGTPGVWDSVTVGGSGGIAQIKAGPSPYVKVVGTDSVRFIMDSVANRLGFSSVSFVNSWLYSYDNFWSATTSNGYVNTGLTVALSGNKVSLTGNGNNYSQQYTKSQNSYYEHWLREDTVVINNTISATTYGIGNGINTQSNIGWVDLSTGGNAGKGFIVTNGIVQATSAGAITFANGDTIILKTQRARDTLIFTVTNKANASATTVQRIVATAFQVGATDLIHKIGQFGLFVKGGTYILTGSRTTIQEQQQSPLVLFGDSKFQGYSVTNWSDRISDRLNAAGIRTINMGSSGDNYANFLSRIGDVIQMHPQQVILETSNDLRQGATLATAIANYESLKGILEAAGIKVWVLTLPETGSFAGVMAQFDSAMKQMHPLEYIGIYAKIAACGAPCLAADLVHLTSIGNDSTAKGIIASVKINTPLYIPNQNVYSPYITEGTKTFYNVAAIGGNPSFTGATGTFKLGTPSTAAFDIQANGKIMRLNWTNALPLINFFNSSGSAFGVFHLDSLGNIGIGKGLYSTALPTSSNSIIMGNNAAAFAVAAGTSGSVIIGGFANGGVTNQNTSGAVAIGTQSLYYETNQNRFGISSGNTQNLMYGDFTNGRLRINPGTNGTSPLLLTASAQFEVSSTNRGVLLTPMTTANRTAIATPATGLHVTNSDSSGRLEFYDGSAYQIYADRNWVRANVPSVFTGSANQIVATPDNSSGLASLRSMVVRDLPTTTTWPAQSAIGNIFSQDYFTNNSLADVFVNASGGTNSSVTALNGKLIVTASAPAYTNYDLWKSTYYTMLAHNQWMAEFRDSIGGNGFAMVLRDPTIGLVGYLSGTAGASTINILNQSGSAYSSAAGPTITIGHDYRVILTVNDTSASFSAYDITAGGSTFTTSKTFSPGGGQIPRIAQLGFFAFTGTYNVSKLQFSSTDTKNPNAIAFVDSKGREYTPTTFNRRWVDQLNAVYPSVVMYGATAMKLTDFISAKDEWGLINGQQYIVQAHSNDLRATGFTSKFQSDYTNLINSIVAGNAKPIIVVIPEDSTGGGIGMTAFKNWASATWPQYYVDVWTSMTTSGDNKLRASMNVGDGIHFNQVGHDTLAAVLIRSGKITTLDPTRRSELRTDDNTIGRIGDSVYLKFKVLKRLGYMPYWNTDGNLSNSPHQFNGSVAGYNATKPFTPTTGADFTVNGGVSTSGGTGGYYMESRNGTAGAAVYSIYVLSNILRTYNNTSGKDLDRQDSIGRKLWGIAKTGSALTPSAYGDYFGGDGTAGNAPIKLRAGTLLGTPENGAVEADASHIYFTAGGTRFQLDQQSGSLTVGTFNNTSTANGLDITSGQISLHAADGTNPGAVTTGTQTIAGSKTFSSAPTFSTLTSSGANDSVLTVDPTTGLVHKRNGNSTLKVANGLSASSTNDSLFWGGTLIQNTSVANAGFSVGFSGSGIMSITSPLTFGSASVGDANYSVSTERFVKLSTVITAGRTLTLPSASTYAGRMLTITNYNNTLNSWTVTPTILDGTGSGIPVNLLVNGATYNLYSDGTSWIIGGISYAVTASITPGWQSFTTGTSGTVNNNVTNVLFNPASVIATYTLTLPSNPADGQLVKIHFGGTIGSNAAVVTALTISPNSGQSIIQKAAPTTGLGGDDYTYVYNIALSIWYRE